MKKEATTEINFSDHESTFSLSFSSIYRLFCAKANFFFQICFCYSNFSFFFSSRGNKQILVSLVRFSFTRKTQKGQPLGQKLSRGTTKLNLRDTKQYCTLPRDTKICLFPLEKKKKKLSSKKNLQKNWPWQKKACKKMKKTMKKWIRGPKILSRWSFPFSRSQLPIKEPLFFPVKNIVVNRDT